MIEELEKNIDTEISMLREIASYMNAMERASPEERKLLNGAINSLKNRMRMINDSIPEILLNIYSIKRLPGQERKTNLEKIRISSRGQERIISLSKEDKEKFMKETMLNENLLRKIKKKEEAKSEPTMRFQPARGYIRYANKFFLKSAKKSIEKGYFRPLSKELKRANINILFESYIAMIYFTTLLSFIVSLFILVFVSILNFGLGLKLLWVPLIVPILVFSALYYYPTTERKAYASRIEQELPFAVIYMSAISGSGIEPTKIFKIIATSKEYPYLRREMRKVLNQINIYGYDLVTSLNNVSKVSPSASLSELLSGMSTTINTGGSLSEFFEKRSQTLLLNYRLKRENYTKLAETFMDIYISVVIATPMILMLLLIVLSISAPDLGISPNILTFLIVSAISVVNIFFLIFLQIKQPSY